MPNRTALILTNIPRLKGSSSYRIDFIYENVTLINRTKKAGELQAKPNCNVQAEHYCDCCGAFEIDVSKKCGINIEVGTHYKPKQVIISFGTNILTDPVWNTCVSL